MTTTKQQHQQHTQGRKPQAFLSAFLSLPKEPKELTSHFDTAFYRINHVPYLVI